MEGYLKVVKYMKETLQACSTATSGDFSIQKSGKKHSGASSSFFWGGWGGGVD